MSDTFSPEERSRIMSRVKSRDTAPELVVRRLIHRMGYRYRLHAANLIGHPDVVLPRHKRVVFVHGCFWHGHEGCRRGARPSTNVDFWNRKIERNKARDVEVRRKLEADGWSVLVVWQCETRDTAALEKRLRIFLETGRDGAVAVAE